MKIEFGIDKELDKELVNAFLNKKKAGHDMGKTLVRLHPKLKGINKSPKKKEIISEYVDEFYEKNHEQILKKIEETRQAWNKIEKEFFKQTEKLFNKKPGEYTAKLTIIGTYPRWIDKKEFCYSYERSDKRNMKIICHELMHFFFYDYIDEKYPNKLTDEQLWDFSEIFNAIILNQKEFRKFFSPYKNLPYPEHEGLTKKFGKMYKKSKTLNEFIEKVIEYYNN